MALHWQERKALLPVTESIWFHCQLVRDDFVSFFFFLQLFKKLSTKYEVFDGPERYKTVHESWTMLNYVIIEQPCWWRTSLEMSLTRIALFSIKSLPDYKENIESMTAFTVQLKEGRILNRQQRSALLVSSTSWTGMLSLTMHCFTIQL